MNEFDQPEPSGIELKYWYCLPLIFCVYAIEALARTRGLSTGWIVNAGVAMTASHCVLFSIQSRTFSVCREWWASVLLYLFLVSSVALNDNPNKAEAYIGVLHIFAYGIFAPLCITGLRHWNYASIATMVLGSAVLGASLAIIPKNEIGMITSGGFRLNSLHSSSLAGSLIVMAVFFSHSWGVIGPTLRNSLRVVAIVIAGSWLAHCNSRGQVVAVFVSVLSLGAYEASSARKGWRKLVIVIPVLAVVAWLVTTGESSWRWDEKHLRSGIGHRLRFATRVLEDWSDSDWTTWICGLGGGYSWRVNKTHPHNPLVEVLTEYGVVAFCVYGYVLASGLRRGFQLLRLHIDTPSLRMILCLLLYYFVVSLKQGYVFFSAFSLFFSLALCQLDQRHRLALRWRSRRRYAELK